MRIVEFHAIKEAISIQEDLEALIQGQRQAFIDFSQNKIQIPLPLQMTFVEEDGDCHVKAGYRNGGNYFVVKVATGFYQNAKKNIPPSDGVSLVFAQRSGQLEMIIRDQGFLTTLRTALAAAVVAPLTPWKVSNIGIVGTGQLALQSYDVLRHLFPTAQFHLWGRSQEKVNKIEETHPDIHACFALSDLVAKSNILITTTASTEPFFNTEMITAPLHIIALGADDCHKSECAPSIYKRADVVIVDSYDQATKFGDVFRATNANMLDVTKIAELGRLLESGLPSGAQFIVTDLTGIAAQDIAIAEFVISKL